MNAVLALVMGLLLIGAGTAAHRTLAEHGPQGARSEVQPTASPKSHEANDVAQGNTLKDESVSPRADANGDVLPPGAVARIGSRRWRVAYQANDCLRPITDKTGRTLAVWAGHARTLVPPFFRSLRAVSMAWAANLWARSRISNSVAPKSCASGFETMIRAICNASSWALLPMIAANRWASASCSGVKTMSVMGMPPR
jgi:hypothetical protein